MSKHWSFHPGVRTGDQLSVGERAADMLKKWFGTWTILGGIAAFLVFYLLVVTDPGELRLNLALSCLAAVQGIVLQIAANRGDRINAELAKHDFETNRQALAQIEENTRITRMIVAHLGIREPTEPADGPVDPDDRSGLFAPRPN